MPSDAFDSPLPNVPEGHISVDNLRFHQTDMDMRRLPSFNDSVCNINDLNMESYRQPEVDPVRNRRKFEKWFKYRSLKIAFESIKVDVGGYVHIPWASVIYSMSMGRSLKGARDGAYGR